MVKPVDMTDLAPDRRARQLPDGRWEVTVVPPAAIGGPGRTVVLTEEQYARYLLWRSGIKMIQDALPELTASEREALMSGLTDEQFSEIMSPMDGGRE